MNLVKKISPAVFGIALICFFLPFINISCSGEKILTLTGVQLVTGTTVGQSGSFGESERIDPEVLAIVALICVIVGLILSFAKGKNTSIAPAIVGAVGVIVLLVLKAKTDNAILKQGEGMLQVGYGIGFWFTFLSFLCAVGLNIFIAVQDKGPVEDDSG